MDLSSMGDTTTVPHNVHVRLNVGGAHLQTSLHTVIEGARLGYDCFQSLCVKVLQVSQDSNQEPVWNRVKLVSTTMGNIFSTRTPHTLEPLVLSSSLSLGIPFPRSTQCERGV